MRPFARLLLPLLALLTLAGCGSGIKLGGFGVSLVDIKGVESSLLESRVTVTIRILNENVHPIGVTGSKHTLSLNGEKVGRAVSSTAVGIPQLSTGTMDVTFLVNNVALVNRLRSLKDGGRLTYDLESTLFIRAGEDELSYKTRGSGVLEVPPSLTAP